MNYSSIVSDYNEPRAVVDKDKITERLRLIKLYAEQHQYVELQSDYYGMDMYYYDARNKQMYKVSSLCDWMCKNTPIFEPSNDAHILALNSLI